MEPASPSVYSTSSPRSALHNRVSVLLNRSPRTSVDSPPSHASMRASQKLRLAIAPRPSFRALAIRSNSTRPPSTRSVIDPTAPQVLHTASPTVRSPLTPLTPQQRLEALYASPLSPINHTWHTWQTVTQENPQTLPQPASRTRQRKHSKKKWSKLFSASSFRRHRVRTKAIFATVFGITLLITLGIYLGLATTGIASGLMFHILFIIFILALTTVFCHSLLTMCLLILKPTTRRTAEPITPSSTMVADLPPEKPIPIVMAIDEEAALSPFSSDSPDVEKPLVRPPPPVYGVWRDTKRMDPNLVHWAKLPPSPDTPTYEQALQDIQRVVGNRPPSYVNGVLQIEEARDTRHDSAVHPLERERVEMLFGELR